MRGLTLAQAVARFGRDAKAKFANVAASGEPEDQLRAPFEVLLKDLAALVGHDPDRVAAVGETAIRELNTRPDFAITVRGALVGHVELKAPGKGADPRRLKGHDKLQWSRLRCLPNVLYSDGNAFSLWRNGELHGAIVRLDGDIETSGDRLGDAPGLQALFDAFLGWFPQAPRSARELAEVSARLCRLLREEVVEALDGGSQALGELQADWRDLLFPEASPAEFADGYAQAVTFGLLMAKARGIRLADGLHAVAEGLKPTSSLIGTALQLLTDGADTRQVLSTALDTLVRVLDAVAWDVISKGKADAWLYFYEDFLDVYDNALRKRTGSYYTPPEVVGAMVGLVDEALRGPSFGQARGIAAPGVTVADPATGTGTFVLGLMRRVAAIVQDDEGPGAVGPAIDAALSRLIAFELQLGPFAVAQLRVLAEAQALTGHLPRAAPRMFVTDTLADPKDEGGRFPGYLAPIGRQRRDANRIKREAPITVVIGNPPYKEKAKGRGGWVEGADKGKGQYAPLDDWQPDPAWGAGAHAKHLRNLYVYFWRWAAWKVFDRSVDAGAAPGSAERTGSGDGRGIVAYITVAGFLAGPGFQGMRARLRRQCDAIHVIDCSPEGHQPEGATRIFQGVQQPVCIVLAERWRQPAALGQDEPAALATVRWRSLPAGPRQQKFDALARIRLDDDGWQVCPAEPRAPFLPASERVWTDYVPLDDIFSYGGSGVQPMRVWVIAPDAASLLERWRELMQAPADKKQMLFHPTLRGGLPADRHVDTVLHAQLPGFPGSLTPIAKETQSCHPPAQYGTRSFDRQWIIPDVRVITQPNGLLWETLSNRQVYTTGLHDRHPGEGPALTFTALPPDKHHFNGRGGRAYPLWRDRAATQPNLSAGFLAAWAGALGLPIGPEDAVAYLAAVGAHPGYVRKFDAHLRQPGLRIPISASAELTAEAVLLGRRVVWLHTFGERMADARAGRPAGPPRLPPDRRPLVPAGGAIPDTPEGFPDSIDHDATAQRLRLGSGYIAPVSSAVWNYRVGGSQVLVQWFNSRRKDRSRPIIGDRRPPSPLGLIQPDTWPAEYTSELLNVLNVLGLLVDLEPVQAALLERVCTGPTLDATALGLRGLPQADPLAGTRPRHDADQPELF